MELLTVKEAAQFLRLSRSQVYVLCQRRELPHIRMGKRIAIRKDKLIEWMMARALQEGMELGNQVTRELFPKV
jgi:excisionase family DNA binding protein